MALIDTIINVDIILNSLVPTKGNFGTPAVAAEFPPTIFPERVRTYFDTDGMIADGFTPNDPAFKLAAAVTQQSPHPPTFKVIRLDPFDPASASNPVQQKFTFQVNLPNGNLNNLDVGKKIGLTLTDPTGTVTTNYYTVATSDTNTTIATALAALLTTTFGGNGTVTHSTDTVTVLVTAANAMWFVKGITYGKYQSLQWSALHSAVSANTGLTPSLNEAVTIDNDWYDLSISYTDPANIQAAAAFCQTTDRPKLFTYITLDYDCTTGPAPTGIMGTLKGLSYRRVYGQFAGDSSQYGATALGAQRLTATPGSDTWAFKNLVGVSPDDTLTASQITAITANNGNYYVTIKGVPNTQDGRSAQGQFIDLQRGADALKDDIQNRVYNLELNSEKVPYTTEGLMLIRNAISDALTAAVASGFLSNDPGEQFTVTMPNILTVDPIDKKNRILRGAGFTAVAQGAVQKAFIKGTINL